MIAEAFKFNSYETLGGLMSGLGADHEFDFFLHVLYRIKQNEKFLMRSC